MMLINNYVIITDCYLIFKSMTFMMISSKKYIIRVAKLFSIIMKIFDNVETNIYKIRKMSNSKTFINKMFLELFTHHVYMKKNGFCKKDF
jgi:hypothetical protein